MRVWRRRWFCILCLIVLAIGGLALNEYWQRRQAAEELREVLAELDQAEPGWRLEQIEANRRVVPDEQNGALLVVKAHGALPKGWTSKPLDELEKIAPPVQISEEIAKQLRAELAIAEPALIEARKLIGYPHGRYAIQYAPDFISTLIKEQQDARTIGALLFLDASASIQDGHPDKAWHSARALLNVGRSLGDEPLLITVLTRMAMQGRTIQCLERILGHRAVSDGELAMVQDALTDEVAENLFLIGMRGERGGMHQLMAILENSDMPVTVAMEGLTTVRKPQANWWDHVNDVFARKMVFRSHRWLVNHHRHIIDAAQLPAPERYAGLEKLDQTTREFFALRDNDYILATILAPAFVKVAEAERRHDTHLHCAIAALAAERFRLQHQRWPASLDGLVQAKLLKEAPLDLYSGKPVQLRRAPDGIVIYSVGHEGTYKGEALDRLDEFGSIGLRIEFRLWDEAKRRQPPLPPRKIDEDR